MKIVLRLEEIDKNDISVAGGKGAQLGELKKAGFNVPEGFVVSVDVYKTLVKKIRKGIKGILTNLDVENTEALEKASRKVQSLITSLKLSQEVGIEVLEAYRSLGGPVAVRSSATSEDLKEASFAGQMTTFLNVTEDKIIESVKRCMASLFTARAIYYRTQHRIAHEKVSIAAVVQNMVGAKKAGVAFSVNPVTNNTTEIVVEAVAGLGESLVSGKTTPDNYVIEKNTNRIKEQRSGKEPILNDSEISELASIAKKIEGHYKFPQDIEWAIDNKGKMYILQSRPVTTLRIHNMPVWKKILAREYGVQYTELSLKCLSPINKVIVPTSFYEQIYVPEDGNEVCYINETKWNEFVFSLKSKYLDTPKNYARFEKLFMQAGNNYMKTAEKIAESDIQKASNEELKRLYLDYLNKNIKYGPFIWMQFIINNFFADKAKEIIMSKVGSDNRQLHDFVDVALRPGKKAAALQLSEIAAKWLSLSEKERMESYEKFKWVPCLDIHNRPWTKEEFFSRIREFKKVDKELTVSYGELLKKIKPTVTEQYILDATKRLSYLKDLKDDFRRQGVMHGQKLFQEIARRMDVELVDISYMLEEEVLDFLGGGKRISRNIVEERKKGFVVYFSDSRVICKSGKYIDSTLSDLGIVTLEKFSEEVKGTTASAGIAKGIVKIVKGVSDLAKVKKGDIMVAVTTHPDYVPAMRRTAGIVTDEGGITSHAAIVARELGIPCIVGTHHATKSLKDGDEVEIDGNAGFVRKIKK